MIVFALLMSASLALPVAHSQQGKSLLESVIGEPTGNNGYEEYLMAADTLRALGDAPEFLAIKGRVYGWEEPAMSRLESAMHFRPALDLVRAGNRKPVFIPRMDAGFERVERFLWSIPFGELPFAELFAFREVGRAFEAEVYWKFSEGRTAEGTRSIVDCLTFGHNIQSGSLVHYHIGCAIESAMFKQVEQRLQQFSKADANRLEQFADKVLRLPPQHQFAVKREIAHAVHFNDYMFNAFESMLTTWNELPEAEREDLEEQYPLLKLFPEMTLAGRERVKRRVLTFWLQLDLDLAGIFRRPESEWELPGPPKEDAPLNAALSDTVSTWNLSIRRAVEIRTRFRLMRLHALIIQFRWEYDRLPNSLDELKAVKAVKDPLTGGEFVYERDEGSYELYSRGNEDTGRIFLTYRAI
ncbi:MAG: hypothetical protein IH851_04960 [Armatimonadetes bacterium]|nr:hypothetical protein [Armatimonadota bacterium]